jgi:pimeloyl-ACP methyl ester carboxylesterase
VLVQGLGFDRAGWVPVVRGLAARFRLIMIDNRGSGRSDGSTDSLTVRHMAGDVVAVLRAARVAKAHVLGISLGGMIAQEVAITYPGVVDRLVLVATTPGWPYAFPMPARSVRLLAANRHLPREVALRRNVENALSPATVAQRPELVDRIVAHEQRRPTAPDAWAAQAAAGARFAGGLRQASIRVPTLVLHGDADVVVDPRNARLLAQRVPRSRLVRFPGLGHLLLWEDPAAFVAQVSAFLLDRGK